MKSIDRRKHHYIPQFILRNFTIPGSLSLSAFDKWNCKAFGVAVPDAAAETGYNTFEVAGEPVCAEHIFTRLEDAASPVIRRIVADERVHNISISESAALVPFIVAQMLRSKNHRAISQQIGHEMRALAEAEGSPSFKEWVGSFDAKVEKAMTLQHLEREIVQLCPPFVDKDLLLFRSEGQPFIIGDSPLTRTNTTFPSDVRGTTGIASKGVEIYMPLSPRLTLGFMCPSIRQVFEKGIIVSGRKAPAFAFDYVLAVQKQKTLDLEEQNVIHMNSLQVLSAERFIYSSTGDFSLAREMIADNLDARKGSRLTTNASQRSRRPRHTI